MKYRVGDKINVQEYKTVQGKVISVPDAGGNLMHLQFRRWVGCPICNVHIGQLRMRSGEIQSAGITELLFFHSPAAEIAEFQADIPFAMIGDPDKKFYKKFGVESSIIFFLSFRAILAAFKGLSSGRFNLNMKNGPLGLPADFLVSSDGIIRAVKYGRHAYDQWSVDELLSLARKNSKAVNEESAPLISGEIRKNFA